MGIQQFEGFTFNHVDQNTELYKTKTAEQVKEDFDSRGEELKVKLNELIEGHNTHETEIERKASIDEFNSHKTSGDHDQRYRKVEESYSKTETDNLVAGVVLGQLPNDSLTEQKMASDMKKNVTGGVVGYDEYTLSLTNIETQQGDLNQLPTTDKTNLVNSIKEVFTNASNGKQNWVDVIGTPLLNTDTFSTLKTKTQTIKNSIATHLINKGQPSAASESLQDLANKIDLIESSSIKSIQHGYTYFSGTSKNIVINNVDMESAILFIEIEEVKWGNYGAEKTTVAGEITSSTNINLIATNADNIAIAWKVVEFNNVKSIQKGIKTVSYSNRSGSISVSSYNTQKSFLVSSFYSTDTSTCRATQVAGVHQNNSTSVGYKCQPNTGQVSIYWQLIEFN